MCLREAVQNGLSLCELTWLNCILVVLFSSKILNRNRIMYGRKKKHTDLQSVPPIYTFFYSAGCPPVEAIYNSMPYLVIFAHSCDSTK